MRSPVEVAAKWNAADPAAFRESLSPEEAGGTPLSKVERAYAEGRSYSLKVTLKNGITKDIRLIADRRVDAFIEMVTIAEDELWDDQIARVEIDDITERFE